MSGEDHGSYIEQANDTLRRGGKLGIGAGPAFAQLALVRATAAIADELRMIREHLERKREAAIE